ncbi:MAG: SpoIIE family protein phosphatase [Spirochaetota bacterium]|nr:SpoIIE family protein phosphatase [Spirochaetota bacterium]
MIKKIINLSLLLFLIALNIFFINRAVQLSKIYPFKRIIVGNTFFYNTSSVEDIIKYKSRIVKIEGEPVTKSNLIKLLTRYKDLKELEIVIKQNGALIQKKIPNRGINYDLLWLMLFMILFANIHYVWGYIIKIINPDLFQAKIYFNLTLLIGLFYFLLFEHIFSNNAQMIWLAIIIMLGYSSIHTGYRILNKEAIRYATLSLIGYAIFIVISSIYRLQDPDRLLPYPHLLMFLFLCSLFLIGNICYATIKERNKYMIKVTVTVAIGILVGTIIPIICFFLLIYFDLYISIILFASFTLAIPLLVGNGLLQYTYHNFNSFHKTNVLTFIVNCLLAIIGSTNLYYISQLDTSTFHMIIYYTILVLFLLFLLDAKRLIGISVNNIGFRKRGEFVYSLQKIAERVTSPEHLSNQNYIAIVMEEIFSEIIGLINTSFMILVLFDDSMYNSYENLNGYVENLSKDSNLLKFFKRNRATIIQNSLMNNYMLEDSICKFLEERNIYLAMPIFREEDVKAALLIGQKGNEDLYSNDEMNYLQTAASQLYQLIENDILLQDYIDKKRYEEELDVASYIQLRLFPKKAPERRGLNISFYNRPYFKVMGDYFDFINIDNDRTAIIIGDVSGHGLKAAMTLSVISIIAHVMLKDKKSIENTVKEMNHYLISRYKGIELITLFIGIFNKKTRILSYINAGHLAPIIIRNDNKNLLFLPGRAKILGADPDTEYPSYRYTLKKNDQLILYTDGIVEIHNDETNKAFIEENLLDTISQNIEVDVEGKLNSIIEHINKNKLHESIQDDITLIGVEIL